jgi:ketosteroid isomerase-like protein
MGQRDVEVVRAIFDAAARRDVAGVLALYAPNVVFDVSRVPHATLIGEGIYEGHDGLRAWFRAWYEPWEDLDEHCDELLDAGGQVISFVTQRGRGRHSGADVELRNLSGVWNVQAGKVTRVVWFPTRDEALRAAGVRA